MDGPISTRGNHMRIIKKALVVKVERPVVAHTDDTWAVTIVYGKKAGCRRTVFVTGDAPQMGTLIEVGLG